MSSKCKILGRDNLASHNAETCPHKSIPEQLLLISYLLHPFLSSLVHPQLERCSAANIQACTSPAQKQAGFSSTLCITGSFARKTFWLALFFLVLDEENLLDVFSLWLNVTGLVSNILYSKKPRQLAKPWLFKS